MEETLTTIVISINIFHWLTAGQFLHLTCQKTTPENNDHFNIVFNILCKML